MLDLFQRLLHQYLASGKRRYLILIGGCSRTGKSTLAEYLYLKFLEKGIKTLVVRLDNWLLGIDQRTGKETVRERYKSPEIVEAIRNIIQGKKVYPPVYNPKTRRVLPQQSKQPLELDKGICIIDGVIALDLPELREVSDFKIYTEVPDDVRKQRLMDFYVNYKNCSREEAEKIIQDRESEEVITVKKTKPHANAIYDSTNKI